MTSTQKADGRVWVPCPDPYCIGGRDAGGPSIFACKTCGGTRMTAKPGIFSKPRKTPIHKPRT